jgi:hypothetical protein
MHLIFDHENVYLDSKSEYDINSVNERLYLKSLFAKIEQQLGDDFKSFDFYVLFSADSAVIPESTQITKKNKVLFWFSDESGEFPSHLTEHYSSIFKSYIKKESLNVYSNPLGYVNEFEEAGGRTVVNKDINVFFSGNLNKNRIGIYELLFFRKFKALKFLKILPRQFLKVLFKTLTTKNVSKDKDVLLFSAGFKSGLVYKTYYNYLLRSKFILCPKGFKSAETFRHIEALHSGSIVISEKMPDVPIYANNPFITYSSYSELNEILDKITNNEYDEAKLAERHKAFYKSNLEVHAVAARIAKICKAQIIPA